METDTRPSQNNDAEYCVEHDGKSKGRMYTCAECGARICRDCVVLLKKHQPCPVYHSAQIDKILRSAIWPAIQHA